MLFVEFIMFTAILMDFTLMMDTLASKSKTKAMEFSREFYNQLGVKRGNFVCSSYGLSVLLSLLVAGTISSTRQELRDAIRFGEAVIGRSSTDNKETLLSLGEERSPTYELYFCNSIWVQSGYPVKTSYIKDLEEFYNAQTFDVDLKDAYSKLDMNDWVAEKTRGNIKDVIAVIPDPVHPLLLIDAVYVKIFWEELAGHVSQHLELYNHKYTNTSKLVPMVTLTGNYSHKTRGHSTVVRIPYAQYCYLYIVFPHKESDMAAVEKVLFRNWTDPLEATLSNKRFQITIPMFKISTTIELRDIVKSMGVRDAFRKTMVRKHDFAPISDRPGLYVGELYQKAVMDFGPRKNPVNLSTRKMAGNLQNMLVVNHKFLFFIKHKDADLPLLKGRVELVD